MTEDQHPYHCPTCNAAFATFGDLASHKHHAAPTMGQRLGKITLEHILFGIVLGFWGIMCIGVIAAMLLGRFR